MALEMVQSARARGMQFQWVSADAAYGCSHEFCAEIEQMGLYYMLDASMGACVWDADPSPITQRKGNRGDQKQCGRLGTLKPGDGNSPTCSGSVLPSRPASGDPKDYQR